MKTWASWRAPAKAAGGASNARADRQAAITRVFTGTSGWAMAAAGHGEAMLRPPSLTASPRGASDGLAAPNGGTETKTPGRAGRFPGPQARRGLRVRRPAAP